MNPYDLVPYSLATVVVVVTFIRDYLRSRAKHPGR
jgi:hypothetical protein